MARKRKRSTGTPRRRRRSLSQGGLPMLSAGRKVARRRRRRRLSEGEILNLKNPQQDPLIMGAAGGAADMVLKGVIPKVVYQNPDGTERKGGKYLKGLALLAGAYFAKRAKQPFLAAGMAGGAAVLTMQSLGMLADGNLLSNRYTRPGLLMQRDENGTYYLPNGGNRIYPNYQPLYEGMAEGDRDLMMSI